MVFGRRRRERDLDEEIRSHFRMAGEERVARGEARDEAERAARREFGNDVHVREVTRTMWGGMWLDRLAQDLRFGVRSLIRHPRYSVVSAVTLALGLGASVAIFSVVETVLLRPLPYEEADRLVMVETYLTSLDEIDGSSVANVEDWSTLSSSIEALTYFRRPTISQVTLGGELPRRVQEGLVGRGFFDVAGTSPAGGRTFTTDELARGEEVAVVRADLWEERFGMDVFAPGRTIVVDGVDHPVVGVMPRTFQLPTRETQLWRPLSVSAWWKEWSTSRETDGVVALARLRPSATLEQARAEMSSVAARLRQAHAANADKDVRLTPLAELIAAEREARRALWLLVAAVLLLLALACGNVAGLSAARGSWRGREMGVRTAIGAGRGRLVRQLLTESFILALIASVSGICVAALGVELLSVFGPASLPRFEQLSLSPAAIVFAAVVGSATVALFGLLPALRSSRVAPASALQAGSRTHAGSRHLDSYLVAGQVALASVLLVGGGLLVTSFLRAAAVDPGYEAENLAIVPIDLPLDRYPTNGRILEYHRLASQRLETIPGVVAAGSIGRFFELAGSGTDPRGRSERLFAAEGGTTDWPGGQPPAMGGGGGGGITASYLQALGLPLLSGRYLDDGDLETSLRDAGGGVEAIVVNEAMARAFWPGRDPVGRRFQFGSAAFDPQRFAYQVVGVVPDVRNLSLDEPAGPSFYIADASRSMDLVVRTSVDAASLLPSIRGTLRELDTGLPLEIRTARAELTERLAIRRFQAGLIAAFAIMALLLAAGGVYAMLAYYVASRTREIGIRRALGAARAATLFHVMRKCGGPVGLGLLAGLLAAAAGAGLLESLLFEVEPLDLGVYLATALVLLLAAAAASYLPALAATKVEPMEAVRAEG
ncbi:MAG TPA: ADOP family duplicated permease [Longimicrobiales bacterium]|nr:ADOP family duplicated permease [Longimicrobiales bacterium]